MSRYDDRRRQKARTLTRKAQRQLKYRDTLADAQMRGVR